MKYLSLLTISKTHNPCFITFYLKSQFLIIKFLLAIWMLVCLWFNPVNIFSPNSFWKCILQWAYIQQCSCLHCMWTSLTDPSFPILFTCWRFFLKNQHLCFYPIVFLSFFLLFVVVFRILLTLPPQTICLPHLRYFLRKHVCRSLLLFTSLR